MNIKKRVLSAGLTFASALLFDMSPCFLNRIVLR